MVAQSTSVQALHPSLDTFSAIRAGDDDAFAQLWGAWQPRIYAMGAKLASNPYDRDEYVAIGIEALWHASRSFPVGSGGNFERYATKAVHHAMLDGLRAKKSQKATIAVFVEPEFLHSDFGTSDATVAVDAPVLEQWISSLVDRDRDIITSIYFEGLTQAEVARRLGLTRTRVSQIHNSLLQQANAYLNSFN